MRLVRNILGLTVVHNVNQTKKATREQVRLIRRQNAILQEQMRQAWLQEQYLAQIEALAWEQYREDYRRWYESQYGPSPPQITQ